MEEKERRERGGERMEEREEKESGRETFFSRWCTPHSFDISLFLSASARLILPLEVVISSTFEPRWLMSSSRC
jgi:hypothetical protein